MGKTKRAELNKQRNVWDRLKASVLISDICLRWQIDFFFWWLWSFFERLCCCGASSKGESLKNNNMWGYWCGLQQWWSSYNTWHILWNQTHWKDDRLTYLVINKNKNNPVIIAPTASGSGNKEWHSQQLRGNFLITLAPYVPRILFLY